MSAPALKPWEDAPACPDPDCGAPCGTREGECIAPGELRCACCGADFPALPGETAQALEADAAWDLEVRVRVMAEHGPDDVALGDDPTDDTPTLRFRMMDWLAARDASLPTCGEYSRTSMAADIGESYETCAAAGWPCDRCRGTGNAPYPGGACLVCDGQGLAS